MKHASRVQAFLRARQTPRSRHSSISRKRFAHERAPRFTAGVAIVLFALFATMLGTPEALAQPAPFGPLDEDKLTASDGVVSDQFGFSVSVSGDRALVGSFVDDDGGMLAGAAYVYGFDGTAWVEEAKLVASDAAAFDFFGFSVALSGDRALVGAFGKSSEAGAAYVFAFDGISWTQQAKLTASDAVAFIDFGLTVSLDGPRAVVGALGALSAGLPTGAAYVYAFDGVSWSEEAKLAPSDGLAGDNFGRGVSISASRVAIGADGADPAGASSGAVYVYDFDGVSWLESGKLIAADGAAADFLGEAVAVSGDRVVAGASQDDDAGTGSGSAYVFDFDGVIWSQAAKLTASDAAANDHFGSAVALDGDRALVGAFSSDVPGVDAGGAYVFSFNGTAWSEETKLVGNDTVADDAFGVSVSLDGDRALSGAAGDDISTGSAYVFSVQQGHRFLLLAETRIDASQQLDMIGDAHSNGVIDFLQGQPSLLTGSLSAVGNIAVGADQSIDGNVTAGGTAVVDPLATVTGTVTSGAAVAPVPLPVLSFTAGGPDITVPRNATVGLAPGSYGTVTVDRRSTLMLSHDGTTGDYFIDRLVVKQRGSILATVVFGPVNVNVVDRINFDQRSTVLSVPGSAAASVTYNVLNRDIDIRQFARIQGMLVAPSGLVSVAQRATVEGAICADEISFGPRAGATLPPISLSSAPAAAPVSPRGGRRASPTLTAPAPSRAGARSSGRQRSGRRR